MKKYSIGICLCIVLLETSSAARHKQPTPQHKPPKQPHHAVQQPNNLFKHTGTPRQQAFGSMTPATLTESINHAPRNLSPNRPQNLSANNPVKLQKSQSQHKKIPRPQSSGSIASVPLKASIAPLDLSATNNKATTHDIGLVAAPDVKAADLQSNIRGRGYTIKQRMQSNRLDTMQRLHVITDLFTQADSLTQQGQKTKTISVSLKELAKVFGMEERQWSGKPIQPNGIFKSVKNAIKNIDPSSKKQIEVSRNRGEDIITLTQHEVE